MIATFLESLLEKVASALGYTYPEGVSLSQPPAHVEGDFATNIAMQLAKSAGKAPRVIAEEFAGELTKLPEIEDVTLAGPGFLNITFSQSYLLGAFARLQADPRQGVSQLSNAKVVVDYGGPNVAKPLHVGHLRSSVIGEAIKGIARFAGDTVDGDIHLGDWGTPMGMLLAALANKYPEWPYFNTELTEFPDSSPVTMEDLQALYPEAAGQFKVDEAFKQQAQQATLELQQGRAGYIALWKHFVAVSVAAVKENMDRLDVTFELWNGESNVHHLIQPMLDDFAARQISEASDGAKIIPLGEDIIPLMLTKSDGAFLYSTTDMATLIDRNEKEYQKVWYVVDQRQKLHFQQLFMAARKTGIVSESMELHHFGFGTVNGPDGRPFKTRDGGAMQLKDLLDLAYAKAAEKITETGMGSQYPQDEQEKIIRAVAIASLKFADLINHRASDYSFDTERFMSFEGKTGPYLLYTLARIQSILRKYEGDLTQVSLANVGEAERPLVIQLFGFSQALEQSYVTGQPHIVCEHLYQLASAYNHFYHNCNILQQTNASIQSGWLALSTVAAAQLKLGLSLVAIPTVERM